MQSTPMQDYVTFFGFNTRPFHPGPPRECASSVGPLGEHFDTLRQALQDGTAISVVTGPAGSGKSTLCERIARCESIPLRSVMLGTGRVDDPRALLQTILFALDIPYEGLDVQELRLRLLKAARDQRPERDGLLVIVDEAELLPTDVLEELRSLAAHSDEGRAEIRLLLCGRIELDERLASPELQGLCQRIGCQITTEALTIEQSARFLSGQLEAAGVAPETVFHEDAFELICRASDGNLTGLCTLADHTLRNAAVAGEQPICLQTVVETLHDLRHLPVNWQMPSLYEPVDNLGDEAGAAGEPGEADSSADAAVVAVPDWNGADDEVAVLEFGSDDPPGGADPHDPIQHSGEQPSMDKEPTSEVVEFAVDDPYAALDQQQGTGSGIVPIGPVMYVAPAVEDAGAADPQNGSFPVQDAPPAGAEHPEVAAASGPAAAQQDAEHEAAAEADAPREAEATCEAEDLSEADGDVDADRDVETETYLSDELQQLSRQIHEALRNTGRLRERSMFRITDWTGDEFEYDVIQPDDGDEPACEPEPLEPAASLEPEQSAGEPESDESERDVVPLSQVEPRNVILDGEDAGTDSSVDSAIRLPDSESRREVKHFVDEAEEPRSRYALLFSRLKRRRADVARRFSEN